MGIRLFSFVVLNHLVEWTMEPMIQVQAMVALGAVRCTVDALVPARIDHSLCVLAQLRSDPVGPHLRRSLVPAPAPPGIDVLRFLFGAIL